MADNVDITVRLRNAKQTEAEAKRVAHSVDGIGDSTNRVGRSAATADRSVTKHRRGLTLLGGAARTGGLALGVGLVAGLGASISAYEDSRKVGAQTNAVIHSTGGVANVTAKGVNSLGTSLMNKTGIDDEAIKSGANLLLTFTNIRNEAGKGNKIFDQTTKAAVDMGAALGTSTTSAAMMLGKALNDPEKGMTRLMKSGVSFTQQQKDQVKTLQDSGNVLGAQKIILGEVNKEFAGSAKAQATPLKKMKTQMGEMFEAVGQFASPLIDKGATALTNFFKGMQNGTGFGGKVVTVVKNIVAAVKGFFTTAGTGKARMAGLRSTMSQLGTIARGFGVAFRVGFNAIMAITRAVLPGIIQMIRGGFTMIRGIIKVISSLMRGDFSGAWNGMKMIVSGAIEFIRGRMNAMVAFARTILGGFLGLFSGLGSRISKATVGIFDGIKDAFKTAINWVIGKWNSLPHLSIGGGSVLGVDIPKVPLGLPSIPPLAAGGLIARSGLALVGERGPEIAEFPRGARVHSNSESRQMASNSTAPSAEARTLDLTAALADRPIEVHSHTYLDGRKISTNVSKQIDRKKNRR